MSAGKMWGVDLLIQHTYFSLIALKSQLRVSLNIVNQVELVVSGIRSDVRVM